MKKLKPIEEPESEDLEVITDATKVKLKKQKDRINKKPKKKIQEYYEN
jgi:hypothetical protein